MPRWMQVRAGGWWRVIAVAVAVLVALVAADVGYWALGGHPVVAVVLPAVLLAGFWLSMTAWRRARSGRMS